MKLLCSLIATCLLFFVPCATACTDTVFVGTYDGHLATSKDGGETWSTVLSNGSCIYSIAADGDTVYAGAESGLFVSHDSGASWSTKNLQNSSGCTPIVESVFVDEEKRVYALIGSVSGCARIALSSDNGDTWPINFALPNPPFAYKAENIYIDGRRIYVATTVDFFPPYDQGGLAFSDDQGATWTFKNRSNGLGANGVQCVVGRGHTIYAGLDKDGGTVSMSKDDGLTWTTANTTALGLQDPVQSMYLQEDTLYVATWGGGLSWSNDFITWTRKTTADGLASNSASKIFASGNDLYLGTFGGLSISRDKGRTWITKTTKDGLPSNDIRAVSARCV